MQNAVFSVAAINSAPRTLALSQDGVEIPEDDVALLQEKAVVTHAENVVANSTQPEDNSIMDHMDFSDSPADAPEMRFDLIMEIPEPIFAHPVAEFGSYISEDHLHCLQGPFELLELQHSMTRACPLSVLYNSHPFTAGVTCESRGYSERLQEHDECFHSSSRWTRPGSPPERTNAGVPSGGLWAAVLDQYDTNHHYPVGNSKRFVACWLCEANSVMASGAVWGQDCSLHPDEYVAATRSADIPNGILSIVPIGDEVCFEGQADYMETAVANVRTTPMGVLFDGPELSTQDCSARGFDKVRDMVDECWPDSRKYIRSENEDIYMINWIGRYWASFNAHDSTEQSGGLWTTVDWVSCSCDLGGAVRDRGLWVAMHGGDALPYTETYCNAMNFPDFSAN